MPARTVTVTVADETASQSSHATLSCSVGAAGLVGATVNPSTYGLPYSQAIEAASQLDGYIGKPLAMSVQRLYLTEGDWKLPVQTALLAAAGVKIQLCMRPSRTLSAAEQKNLAACLASMPAGADWECTLWEEFNDGFFTSAAEFQAYWSFYAPVVLDAGVTLNYNPGVNRAAYPMAVAAFGGLSPSPDRFCCDYYGSAWSDSIYLDSAPSGVPSSVMELADQAGLPFGLGEVGSAAGTAPALTASQWTAFMSYLHGLFYGRLEAGKANADVIAYCSGLPGDNPANVISAATDVKVPGYAQTYGRLSAAVLGT